MRSSSHASRYRRRSRAWFTGASALATLTGASTSVHATPAVLLEQDRGVFSRATASEVGLFDEEISADEALDFAPLTTAVQGTGATPLASSAASANLESKLDGSRIDASGSAVADATTTDADGRGEAPSDSFFEIVFEAAVSEEFTLLGSVGADATLGDGYASVELVDLDTGTVLATHEAGIGEQVGFSDPGLLTAGTQYRLTAFAVAEALSDAVPATTSGDAAYDVILFLPEPSQNAALAVGLAALAGLHALRRRRSHGHAKRSRARGSGRDTAGCDPRGPR